MPQTSKKEITEAQAWVILAEEHDGKRSQSEYLCNTLNNPEGYKAFAVATIPRHVRDVMLDRVTVNIDDRGVAYGFEDNMTAAEEREGRVMACLMFSQIAADEASL